MERISLLEQEALVSEEAFLSTYEIPSRARSSMKFLKDSGMLPLTYGSPLLPAFNRLVAAVFWSGHAANRDEDYPEAGLSLDETLKGMISDDIASLKTTLLHTGRGCHTLGKNGMPYMRLIVNLKGLPLSGGTIEAPDRKVKKPITLPDYLTFVVENFDAISEQELAVELMRGQLEILAASRKYSLGESNRYEVVRLMANASEPHARAMANQVLMMFQYAMPRIGLTPANLKIRKANKTSRNSDDRIEYWEAYLYFPRALQTGARQYYGLFS